MLWRAESADLNIQVGVRVVQCDCGCGETVPKNEYTSIVLEVLDLIVTVQSYGSKWEEQVEMVQLGLATSGSAKRWLER